MKTESLCTISCTLLCWCWYLTMQIITEGRVVLVYSLEVAASGELSPIATIKRQCVLRKVLLDTETRPWWWRRAGFRFGGTGLFGWLKADGWMEERDVAWSQSGLSLVFGSLSARKRNWTVKTHTHSTAVGLVIQILYSVVSWCVGKYCRLSYPTLFCWSSMCLSQVATSLTSSVHSNPSSCVCVCVCPSIFSSAKRSELYHVFLLKILQINSLVFLWTIKCADNN